MADTGVRGEGVKVVLQECKVREDRFVPTKEPPKEFSWGELVEVLAPHKSVDAYKQLSKAETGAYLGLAADRRTGRLGTFFFKNPDRSGNIGWLLKKDPTVPGRIKRIFRVEEAHFERKLEEGVAA